MPQQEGKCTNFGLCTIADSREVITLPEGEEFSCLECGKMLTEVEGKGGAAGGGSKGSGKSKIALAGLAVILLAGGGYFLLTPPEDESKKDEPKIEIPELGKKSPEEIKNEEIKNQEQQIREQQLKEQQAKEQQLKEQQALLQQEKDRLKQEQEKLNQAKALEGKIKRPNPGLDGQKKGPETAVEPPYTGPSSGSIVWEGTVNGTEFITIDNGSANKGSILSGKLPGVPVLIQPKNPKKVGIAGAPGPDNKYQRVTLRVQGNGQTKVELAWSLP